VEFSKAPQFVVLAAFSRYYKSSWIFSYILDLLESRLFLPLVSL